MQSTMLDTHGGIRVADVLRAHGVEFVFSLCGGHISPILIGARQRGLRVIDVRHEATAVYAADAVARLTGVPGVAVVTAGPGLTNTITAVKNAQLAQSPVIVIGGATATLLKGRGSLQDIDQRALMEPHVKSTAFVRTVREIAPALIQAFFEARSGVPGPVFVEIPLDLLYPEDLVRAQHRTMLGDSTRLAARLQRLYVKRHLDGVFRRAPAHAVKPVLVTPPAGRRRTIERARRLIEQAERPILLVGSGALHQPQRVAALRDAVSELGIPTYLSGMARGLLGCSHPLHLRHQRRAALKQADCALVAGTPFDFRLDYGRSIRASATVVAISRCADELTKNRRPALAVHADPAEVVCALAAKIAPRASWKAWLGQCRQRDEDREVQIREQSEARTAHLNPLQVCREIDAKLDDDSVIVGDGGDFVATASYIVRPRAPLSWLDPGVFGTLGPGAGFALGAKLCRPAAEVWLLYGDGAAGYSIVELDTFVRHGIPVIAVVGNDAGWTQIAREQEEIFDDDLGTVLAHSDYHEVARGLGAEGLRVGVAGELEPTLAQAKRAAATGRPVLVNAILGRTDFRKGSISM